MCCIPRFREAACDAEPSLKMIYINDLVRRPPTQCLFADSGWANVTAPALHVARVLAIRRREGERPSTIGLKDPIAAGFSVSLMRARSADSGQSRSEIDESMIRTA